MGPFCVVINCLIKGSIWTSNCLKCYYCSLETCCCHSQAAPLSGGEHALQQWRRCQPPASHSGRECQTERRRGGCGVKTSRWADKKDEGEGKQAACELETEGEKGGRKGKKEGEGIVCLYCVSSQPLKRNNLHNKSEPVCSLVKRLSVTHQYIKPTINKPEFLSELRR